MTAEQTCPATQCHNLKKFYVLFAGKRRCLGEVLARSCLFIFFAGVLQNFEVLPVPGKELPGEDPLPGLILSPQPYTVMLEPRVSYYKTPISVLREQSYSKSKAQEKATIH